MADEPQDQDVLAAIARRQKAVKIVGQKELDERWENATAIGKQHDVRCSGAVDALCSMHAGMGIALYGRLFAVICKQHAVPLIESLARAGYLAGIRCVPLLDLLDVPGFIEAARKIRDRNRALGGAKIPARSSASPVSPKQNP